MSRFTRKAVLALAAVATLGTLAFASNDASARGFGGGGGGMRAHGGGAIHAGGGGMRHIGGGGGFRRIGGGVHFKHPHFRLPHFAHRHHHHWRWRWWAWKRPYYYAAPVVAAGVVASAPVWNRCTCLTKEYTPEGAVVFKDLCTKEVAMNPPAGVQPTAYDPSQDPAAYGALQPQVQAQPMLPQTAVPQIR